MNTHKINLRCTKMTDEETLIDIPPFSVSVARKRRVEFDSDDGAACLRFDVNGSERFQPGRTYIISIDEA